MTSHELDRAINALARRQHGAFSHAQAKQRGASDRMVAHRRATGSWLELARFVYALPGSVPTWLRQAKAAELSIPGSAVSGRSAAALHGMTGFPKGALEVTAPRSARRTSRLARVRHRREVPTTFVAGIRVTTIEQTLLDLASIVQPSVLESALDDLVVGRRTTVDAIRALQPNSGNPVLGSLLAERSVDAYVPPTNALERALYAVLDGPTLPPYERQAQAWWIASANCVDAVLPSWRRIVEADGRRWHTRRADFDRDRERDHHAQMNGFEVTRFSYRQLTGDPGYALEVLRAIGLREAA